MRSFMKIIRIKELAEMLSISKTTIWRMRRSDEFPQPLKIGSRMIAWDLAVIEDWLNSKRV